MAIKLCGSRVEIIFSNSLDKWMGCFRNAAIISVLGVAISGCALTKPGTNYATEEHLKGEVGDTNANFFIEYRASYETQSDATLAQAYVRRGVLLTKTVCHQYLDDAASRANNLNFAKQQFALTTVLTTGILALANAGTDAFQSIALGSSFVIGTADNIRDHYLLGPDADAIIGLVKRSMATVATEIAQNPPQNFDEAYENLQSHSRICTTYEIRRLVRDAIKTAQPEAITKLQNIQDSILRENIGDLVQKSGVITDEQFIGLYWLTAHGMKTPVDEIVEIERLMGSALFNFINPNNGLRKKIRDEFRKMTGPTLGNAAQQVQAQLAAAAAAPPAPVEAPAGVRAFPGSPRARVAVGGRVKVTNPIQRSGRGTGNITVRIK